MQKSSKNLLGIVTLLIVALVLSFIIHQPQPSDHDQITAQIESARAAGENHSVGGVMKIISADYHDAGGLNVDQLHFLLNRYMSRGGAAQVFVSPPGVTVQGDTATSLSQVTVRDAQTGAKQFDQPVTLHWRREDGHRLLFIPTKVWRVVGADYGGGLPGLGEE